MSGKTKKSISKRFRITKNKILMRRAQRQDHLNAKESGGQQRKKRKAKRVDRGNANRLIESRLY
jgi:ribosomal protein L35